MFRFTAMSTANQIFSTDEKPMASMAGTKIGTTMKVISRNSRLMPRMNTATIATATNPYLPPPTAVNHSEVWSEPPSWKNIWLKKVDETNRVITNTTMFSVEVPASLSAFGVSFHSKAAWSAPSLTRSLSTYQLRTANSNAPRTPTEPDSDGVAIPWNIENNTPMINTRIGTIDTSTSVVSMPPRAMRPNSTTKTIGTATNANCGLAISMTRPIIRDIGREIFAAVNTLTLPGRVRCSFGMAGPRWGRK